MNPAGPFYPGTAADLGNSTGAWTTPNNAKVEDGSLAFCDNVGPGGGGFFPNQLVLTGFGFNLPSTAIIDGIKLEIKVSTTDEGGGSVNDAYGGGVLLAYNGGSTAFLSTPNSGQFWPSSGLIWLTYGGSTSLWGKAWTVADVNNANFGASLSASAGHSTSRANVDSARITVYWHTAPAEVPKRYAYKVFNGSSYIGDLPNVITDFAYSQDINTAGAQINVTCAVSADVAMQQLTPLTDEAGNVLTDESDNILYADTQVPIVNTGLSTSGALIRNGNRVQVWEYSYYYPNGKCMFIGQINRWQAGFGGDNGEDTITLAIYHDGADLDNYIARGSPFTYTDDVVQTSQNSNVLATTSSGKSTGWNWYGQTFKVGGGVTNVGAIRLLLYGSGQVTVTLYSNPGTTGVPLGSSTQYVSVGGATEITFGFPAPIPVVAGNSYFFTVTPADGNSIYIYYQNSNVYANGDMYNSNYAGGSGGGGWYPFPANSDLYFKTASSTGSTTATYSSVDPSIGMLEPIMNDYIARGGLIQYTSGSIDATALSLTYTFNTNTVYEAIKAIESISPAAFYYYVDLGTDILYFKNASTTADLTLIRGKHLTDLTLIASIETIKNQVYFSGGATAGVNLYKTYSDNASINAYGVRLDRKSDNRVTVTSTADAIGNTAIASGKDEQYQTNVTILSRTMDITLLKPGMLVAFAGFGTFVDNVLAQIVRVDYKPEMATLTLGVIPKRFTPEVDKITRGLVAQQTIANPSAPS